MICNFEATWSKEIQNIMPDGILGLEYESKAKEHLNQTFKKLNYWQNKNNQQKKLDIKISIHYKKRSLDQNKTMWLLYDILSEFTNISTNQLYQNDLKEFAKMAYIEIPATYLDYIKSEYKIFNIIEDSFLKDLKMVKVGVYLSTSHMTTKQMAEWLDMLFNRICELDIPIELTGRLHILWRDWRQFLNDEKIILNDSIDNQKKYKEQTLLCEACGKYIQNEGSLAHINARGMGGNQESWKETPMNWLHLCDLCHNEFDNGKGVDLFLKKNEHLRFKIENALKKEFK